jgi:SM-20-related protein
MAAVAAHATIRAVPDPEQTPLDLLKSYPGVNVRHSGTTLLDHLEGVHRKLEQWGCRADLCHAGLFHSVYGTEHFRRQTIPISARPRVAAVIGDAAEDLAFRFCTLDTRAFVNSIEAQVPPLGDPRRDTFAFAPEDSDLLHLFIANWLEQQPRMRAIQRGNYHSFLAKVGPLLIAPAAREVEQTFEFATTREAKREITMIADAAGTSQELQILDDLVPMHLQHRLSALMERNIWRYGWKSANTQTAHFFWHSHFAGDNDDGGEASCEAELRGRALIAPVLQLWELVHSTLAVGHLPVRVYANGHTYGCDGHVHTDSDRPGHFTALYYAHPNWEANWGGETMFFDAARSDAVRSAFPRPGRLVFFNGNIPHVARSPSRDCPALRSVIVFKSFCPALGA